MFGLPSGSPGIVAPLYGEGRGLKRRYLRVTSNGSARRSSLWRGAWIETTSHHLNCAATTVAPLYGEGRGLKLFPSASTGCRREVAPLYGEGRGLKRDSVCRVRFAVGVAPLYGEGRGLKPLAVVVACVGGTVAPLYGEGRGLKPRVEALALNRPGRSSLWRGAWIETVSVVP